MKDLRTFELPVSMRVNRHHDAESHEKRDGRRAAETDEWQRYADDGQEPRDHRDVDEHIGKEDERQAADDEPAEGIGCLRRDEEPLAMMTR